MAAEGEKVEKEKVLPKDAQVIASFVEKNPNSTYIMYVCPLLLVQVMVAILKDMGINDFEPRVINQMLEFSYRWSFSFHILAYSRTKVCHGHPGGCQGLL